MKPHGGLSALLYYQLLLAPQLVQKLPVLTAPHEQVQLAGAGLADPQLVQKLPVLTAPHEQVQPAAAAAAPAAAPAADCACIC